MRFQLIDESNIGDHSHLDAGDKCCYMFEYTSGKDYSFSSTNSLISNLKKKPIEKFTNSTAYKFKGQDISKCSAWLSQAINPKWLQIATLVPIPPSKEKQIPNMMTGWCKSVKESMLPSLSMCVNWFCSARQFLPRMKLLNTGLLLMSLWTFTQLTRTRPSLPPAQSE